MNELMKYNQLSEEEILEGLSNNDRKIMTVLYTHLHGKAWAFAQKITRKDLLEEFPNVFHDFFCDLPVMIERKYTYSKNLEGFMMQVFRYKWWKHIGRNKDKAHMLNIDEMEIKDDAQEEYEQKLEAEAGVKKILKGLEMLGEDCRKFLTFFYFEKLSLTEIASRMNITPQFAKVKRFRCMDYLKKKVRNM